MSPAPLTTIWTWDQTAPWALALQYWLAASALASLVIVLIICWQIWRETR